MSLGLGALLGFELHVSLALSFFLRWVLGMGDRNDYKSHKSERQQENGIFQEKQHPEGVLRANEANEIRKEPAHRLLKLVLSVYTRLLGYA